MVSESIGTQLERDRLAIRMARLERAAAALRARARRYESSGRAVPSELRHSLADFERELVRVRDDFEARHGSWSITCRPDRGARELRRR